MHYTIYKTTNLLNGKFYIGKHQTANPDDTYLGSGKALEAAINKYGRDNFKKEVLYIFDSEIAMNSKEKELITESLVNDPKSYNLGIGGEGGPHFKGRKHTIKSRQKMGRLNQKLSKEHRDKISEANRRRVLSYEAIRNMSEATKRRWADPIKRKKLLENNNFCNQ